MSRLKLSSLESKMATIAITVMLIAGTAKAQTEPNAQQASRQSEKVAEQKPTIDADSVKLPKVFNLKQDGNNERYLNFLENPQNPKDFELQVFNRFGVMLYNGNKGWDGTYKEQSVEEGVYICRVQLKRNNGEFRTIVGDVTVIYENDIEKK